MNEFEKRLRAQPFRTLPETWRDVIVPKKGNLQQSQPAAASSLLDKTSGHKDLRAWFWPSPSAWGALAAIWIALFALSKLAAPVGPEQSRLSMTAAAPTAAPISLPLAEHSLRELEIRL